MKKTFRKALACLLAVLMVAFSVPFSALAYSTTVGEANYKWWDDANLPTETPEYEPVNATWAFNRNIAKALLTNTSNAPKRWNARPVVGATVSYLGTADDSLEDLWARYEGYYGKAGFTDAEAAGLIMNPTEIKAGQRIAVTYEFGGVDLMNNGQILSDYDPAFLAPAGYQDEYFFEDEWDAWDTDYTSDYGKVAIENQAFAPVATMDDTRANVGFVAKVATTTSTSSVFIGGYNEMDAKYGIPCATFFFEALQDCDLTEVITFAEGQGGTRIAWGNMDAGFKDELYLMTMSETPYTAVLFAPAIWTNASGSAPETHEHDYQEVSRTAPTCEKDGEIVYECISTTGSCDAMTKTEKIDKLGHNYKSAVTKEPSCTEEGVKTFTCQNPEATCEKHTYTEPIDMIDHKYVNKEVERKNPTCTEAGYVITADVCTVCGAEKADTRENTKLDATDHAWGEWIIDTPATETSVGSKHRVCENDPSHTETEEIPMIECKHEGATHEVDVEVIKAATCKEEGLKSVNVICDVCGQTIETKEVVISVDANNHAGTTHTNDVVTKAATCNATGLKDVQTICDDCGEVISTEKDVVIAIDPTNHVGTTHTNDVVTKAATCQATGLKDVQTICDDCGEVISTEKDVVIAIDPANHVGETTTRDVVIKEATCGEAGIKNIETVCGCGEVLSVEENVEIPATGNHTWGAEFEVVTAEPTVDAEGSKDIKHTCSVCGATETIRTEAIPALKGYIVTVDAADMGKVTLNDIDVTDGAAIKVLAGSQITLTAEPIDGATFVGWTANGKTLVSTDTVFTTTALANVTYTPVFDVVAEAAFTVTFVDAFGNIVAIVDSANLTADAIPVAPTRTGYAYATDNGWSMTNDEILALDSNATVSAQYVKAEDVLYTVVADGCEITANGETANDTVSVPYDTKVTVTNTTATAWIVKDAKTGEEIKVAYGDSYTFFVTADITLTFDTESVDATPQVVNIGKSSVGTAPRIQAAFKATRTMTDDCQYIASGFVYGKGDLGAVTLDDVNGSTVKAIYSKTDSEQFTLTYGLSAQQGTITAVAFLAYVDANGQNQVIYAAPMTYTYGE